MASVKSIFNFFLHKANFFKHFATLVIEVIILSAHPLRPLPAASPGVLQTTFPKRFRVRFAKIADMRFAFGN